MDDLTVQGRELMIDKRKKTEALIAALEKVWLFSLTHIRMQGTKGDWGHCGFHGGADGRSQGQGVDTGPPTSVVIPTWAGVTNFI